MPWHVNPEGEPGECSAQPGECPFKGEHFDTPEEAAAHYERTQAEETFAPVRKAGSNKLTPGDVAEEHVRSLTVPRDTFVTVEDDDSGFSSSPLTETTVDELGNNLQPGHYRGYYYDEKLDEDVPVTVEVNSRGQTTVLRSQDEQVFLPEDSPDSPEVAARVQMRDRVDSFADSLAADAENDYRRDDADRLTMLEASRMISDETTTHDMTTASGATRGLDRLRTLQESFNRSAHIADDEGKASEAAAWWRASEGLADFLPHER